MYYKLFFTQDDSAPYLQDGNPCVLLSCAAAYTPEGLNEGWQKYRTENAAIKAFGLTRNEHS